MNLSSCTQQPPSWWEKLGLNFGIPLPIPLLVRRNGPDEMCRDKAPHMGRQRQATAPYQRFCPEAETLFSGGYTEEEVPKILASIDTYVNHNLEKSPIDTFLQVLKYLSYRDDKVLQGILVETAFYDHLDKFTESKYLSLWKEREVANQFYFLITRLSGIEAPSKLMASDLKYREERFLRYVNLLSPDRQASIRSYRAGSSTILWKLEARYNFPRPRDSSAPALT